MPDPEGEIESSPDAASRQEAAAAGEGTEAPSAPSPSSARRQARKDRPHQQVRTEFRKAEIHHAWFGIENPLRELPGAATGTKAASDIATELKRYVKPASFVGARLAMEQANFVILEGRRGLGKRTGGFALLEELAPGDVDQLVPTVTLEELNAHDYESGAGYIVVDHAVQEVGAEAEFRWGTLLDRIRRAGAYLVLTTSAAVAQHPTITWQRPDPHELLGRLLDEVPGGDGIASRLAERLPEDWTMADVVECARRLRSAPGSFEEALAVFDLATISDVRRWFDGGPDLRDRDRRDVIEVTTLAFSWSASERRFETLAGALEKALDDHLPAPEPSEDSQARPVPNALPSRRTTRRQAEGLVRLHRATTGATVRPTVGFSSPRYRQHVLAELTERYEAPFWDAVQNWLLALVEENPGREETFNIAYGLALFAEVDFDDALELFLEPMSRGDAGPNGTTCAATTLRLMALKDALAPAALQVAVRWVNGTRVAQRITAGDALVAELGVRYPAEAARRLWQLITQDQELADLAIVTPAFLLYSLVEGGSDAIELLELLDHQLNRFAKPGADLRMVDLTMKTVLNVLSITDEQTRQHVVFDLLAKHPTSADLIARLWTRVLCNRRYRVQALDALWDGLSSSKDRAFAVDSLADALDRALPPDERLPFVRDFRSIDVRRRQRERARAESESIAHLLISALEQIHGRPPTEDRK